MATIRKLKSGNWNVQIRSKGKLFASKTLTSYDDAQIWGHQKEKELGCPFPFFVDAGHEYCQRVLDGKPSQMLAANRIDRIVKSSRLQKPMDEITLQDVNAYKQMRLAEVTTTTCRDELLMIRRVFRWYIRELLAESGNVLANPCELLTFPRANKPRDKVISKAELDLLLKEMTPAMAVVTELAFETAMRCSEILNLTPSDLHLEERYLCVVDGKEGSRDVPLTRRAVSLLESSLVACGGRGASCTQWPPTASLRPSEGLELRWG